MKRRLRPSVPGSTIAHFTGTIAGSLICCCKHLKGGLGCLHRHLGRAEADQAVDNERLKGVCPGGGVTREGKRIIWHCT